MIRTSLSDLVAIAYHIVVFGVVLVLMLLATGIAAWSLRLAVLHRRGLLAGVGIALLATALMWLHAWYVLSSWTTWTPPLHPPPIPSPTWSLPTSNASR